MNYILNLIRANNLQPADVIILKKKLFGMLNHFAVFLGYDEYQLPVIVANYTKGTKRVEHHELEQFMQQLEPEKIERFQGTNYQRKQAVNRAISKLGEDNYDYLENNCEHYANYVQKGVPHSQQAESFKEGAAAVAVGAGILGLAALLLGALGGEGNNK